MPERERRMQRPLFSDERSHESNGRAEAASSASAPRVSGGRPAAEAPQSPSAAAGEGVGSPPVPEGLAASAGDGPGPDGDDEGASSSSGRPPKSLLAAAAIAGSILIAIPLLVMSSSDGDKDGKAQKASAEGKPTSGSLMLDGDQGAEADGDYQAEAPPSYGTAEGPKSAGGGGTRKEPKKEKAQEKAQDNDASTERSARTVAASKGSATHVTEKEPKTTATAAKPVDLTNSERLMLKNAMTGRCADLPGKGTGGIQGAIGQYACDAGSDDNQEWDFVTKYRGAGPGGTNLFQIRNSKDGLCMDLPGTGSAAKNTDISENMCIGTKGDNQLWWLQYKGDGKYWLRNYKSAGQCLNVAGWAGVGKDAALLEIRPCLFNDDHAWKLER